MIERDVHLWASAKVLAIISAIVGALFLLMFVFLPDFRWRDLAIGEAIALAVTLYAWSEISGRSSDRRIRRARRLLERSPPGQVRWRRLRGVAALLVAGLLPISVLLAGVAYEERSILVAAIALAGFAWTYVLLLRVINTYVLTVQDNVITVVSVPLPHPRSRVSTVVSGGCWATYASTKDRRARGYDLRITTLEGLLAARSIKLGHVDTLEEAQLVSERLSQVLVEAIGMRVGAAVLGTSDVRDASALVPWQPPWCEITDEARRRYFEEELRRELAKTHELFDRPVRALGERQDCDDVLFQLSGTTTVAVVHLTYVRPPPDRPPWPSTEIYPEISTFVSDRLIPDHADFGDELEDEEQPKTTETP